jgi:hypothetical protein
MALGASAENSGVPEAEIVDHLPLTTTAGLMPPVRGTPHLRSTPPPTRLLCLSEHSQLSLAWF